MEELKEIGIKIRNYADEKILKEAELGSRMASFSSSEIVKIICNESWIINKYSIKLLDDLSEELQAEGFDILWEDVGVSFYAIWGENN